MGGGKYCFQSIEDCVGEMQKKALLIKYLERTELENKEVGHGYRGNEQKDSN